MFGLTAFNCSSAACSLFWKCWMSWESSSSCVYVFNGSTVSFGISSSFKWEICKKEITRVIFLRNPYLVIFTLARHWCIATLHSFIALVAVFSFSSSSIFSPFSSFSRFVNAATSFLTSGRTKRNCSVHKLQWFWWRQFFTSQSNTDGVECSGRNWFDRW